MNKYLIVLATGGTMEAKQMVYSDYQIITANTRKEALAKYNEMNNCDYFYGTCMVEKVMGNMLVVNHAVTYRQLRIFEASINKNR